MDYEDDREDEDEETMDGALAFAELRKMGVPPDVICMQTLEAFREALGALRTALPPTTVSEEVACQVFAVSMAVQNAITVLTAEGAHVAATTTEGSLSDALKRLMEVDLDSLGEGDEGEH